MFLRFGLIFLIFLTTINATTQFEKSITPSKVYTKLIELQKEIHLIKEHFGVKKDPKFVNIKTELLPRHAWQRTYEIFVKMNILREKYNLPIIEPVNMAPTLTTDPSLTYEQILRLLQEVHIFKLRLGISKVIEPVEEYSNKTPTDVYNMLNALSREFDLINGKEFTPSYVFSETIRIYEDFQAIFNKLNIIDKITPPSKNKNANPEDSYKLALELLHSIKKIELELGLKSVDFYAFRRKEVTPSDTFEITQIILAELQVIKAHIGLTHTITRGAKKQSDKTPADVTQMLGWLLKKSQQLSLSLNIR